ncbi:arylamine N-acetyltransferase [Streptomyces sp. NPDC047108]|uniref:arylamine N-acetyltransferase family protein n=1 Tax=Streptomyces sp. NPDC047108 TaxID=3155025 RepID=UPI0033C234ED
MDSAQTDAYLRRIGATPPARADDDALRELQLHHLRSVPFENLSIHLGQEIVLEETSLVDKVVRDRRGGFCYELNGAFAALLTALGWSVTLLAARVFTEPGHVGPPYDHMTLRVESPDGGEPWLADVGFGDHSHHPLRFADRGDQADPSGTFRIVEAPDGDLDVLKDGEPQFRLDTRPRELGDFEATCWWHRTSPKSHFTRSLVCSRLTEDGGRITLSGRKLVTTTADGRRKEELTTDDDVLSAYRSHFGIELRQVPEVREPLSPVSGR